MYDKSSQSGIFEKCPFERRKLGSGSIWEKDMIKIMKKYPRVRYINKKTRII